MTTLLDSFFFSLQWTKQSLYTTIFTKEVDGQAEEVYM